LWHGDKPQFKYEVYYKDSLAHHVSLLSLIANHLINLEITQ